MKKWPPKPFTGAFLKKVEESRKMLDKQPVPIGLPMVIDGEYIYAKEWNAKEWLKKTYGLR
jgi:hypothetical protein